MVVVVAVVVLEVGGIIHRSEELQRTGQDRRTNVFSKPSHSFAWNCAQFGEFLQIGFVSVLDVVVFVVVMVVVLVALLSVVVVVDVHLPHFTGHTTTKPGIVQAACLAIAHAGRSGTPWHFGSVAVLVDVAVVLVVVLVHVLHSIGQSKLNDASAHNNCFTDESAASAAIAHFASSTRPKQFAVEVVVVAVVRVVMVVRVVTVV